MKAFKAYDIRGIYGSDFDGETVYRIGFFLPGLLKTESVLVGYDCRESTPDILSHLIRGITDSGADVYDIGLATTPMVYFATAVHRYRASVQITASHNSAEYNGLKISRSDALPVGYDTGLKELENIIEKGGIQPAVFPGQVKEFPGIKEEYITFLEKFRGDYSNLKFGIDCSNGMASLLVRDVFGNEPAYIYDRMDGSFPGHPPNPLDEELEAVSFFTVEDNVDYTAKIYGSFSGGQLTDELASVSGTALQTGFHTVDFPSSVTLSDTDVFYAYLQLSDGGQPFDCTSDVPVLLGASARTIVESSASPGESFFLEGSTWIDLTTLNPTANFCIKALTNSTTSISGDDEPLMQLLSADPAYPNPFSSHVMLPFTIAESGQVSVCVFDLSGRQVRTITSDEFAAGSHTVSWEGTDGSGNNVTSGVYFVRIWSEGLAVTSRVVLAR